MFMTSLFYLCGVSTTFEHVTEVQQWIWRHWALVSTELPEPTLVKSCWHQHWIFLCVCVCVCVCVRYHPAGVLLLAIIRNSARQNVTL